MRHGPLSARTRSTALILLILPSDDVADAPTSVSKAFTFSLTLDSPNLRSSAPSDDACGVFLGYTDGCVTSNSSDGRVYRGLSLNGHVGVWQSKMNYG